MKVTLKTLQQQTFKIDIEPEQKVRELKELVEKEKGKDFPATGLKLIYAGKILSDDNTLSEYKIDEKGFVVVMVSKTAAEPAKQPEAAAAAAPAPAPTSAPTATPASTVVPTPAAAPAPAESSAVDAARTQQRSAPAEPQGPSLAAAENTLVTGPALEASINEMMNMGFSRPQVQQALQASFNNPDRAVEYLLSDNIPSVEPGSAAPAAPASSPSAETATDASLEQATAAPAAPAAPASADSAPAANSASTDLDFLREQPSFQQMRRLVQSNRAMLPALLQQLGQANPELLRIITQNQAEFVRLLNENPEESGGSGAVEPGSGGAGGAPGQGVIQVTPQEKEAIERLKAMGFSEAMVVQAYFACEKNENAAANFLLQQQFDDDDFS